MVMNPTTTNKDFTVSSLEEFDKMQKREREAIKLEFPKLEGKIGVDGL